VSWRLLTSERIRIDWHEDTAAARIAPRPAPAPGQNRYNLGTAIGAGYWRGKMSVEQATLGGGCFWCLEPIYDALKGVTDVVSGYAGGDVPNPSYELVCTGRTGHAEVVQITFDPAVISYRELLEVFFTVHDPTTLNRQGADVGTQYRSVIFYHSPEQRAIAEEVIADVARQGWYSDPLVTQLAPYETFYPAEDYHQQYFERNPFQGYCRVVIAPKVAKFRQKYLERLKA
jgi:peptide-methionine (S)-S-oxide reductase